MVKQTQDSGISYANPSVLSQQVTDQKTTDLEREFHGGEPGRMEPAMANEAFIEAS